MSERLSSFITGIYEEISLRNKENLALIYDSFLVGIWSLGLGGFSIGWSVGPMAELGGYVLYWHWFLKIIIMMKIIIIPI